MFAPDAGETRGVMLMTGFEAAKVRRQELIERIAECADEIHELDKAMPIMRSQALESDLIQAEPHAL
jgi:hypothetical protein